MSIVRNQYQVEHREVILRDRPEHMMEISPKGTVPVLLLPDGRVIEESLEIMQYVLDWQLSDIENHIRQMPKDVADTGRDPKFRWNS